MDANVLPPDQNLSEKQLKFGYWFVTHKLQLKRGLEFALMAVSAGLFLFTIAMLVKLFLVEDTAFRAMQRQASQNLVNPAVIAARVPKPLSVKTSAALEGGKGTSDAYAEITNPNKDSWASWTGQFSAQGATTTPRREFILPGETKPVVDLGIESPRLTGLKYEIRDLAWHRVDRHDIPDYAAYRDNRLRFDIKDVVFTSAPSPDGKSTVSRVSFTVVNGSAYNYWTVRFIARLYRGTSIAAVNTVELQAMKTGETRKVEMAWVQDLQAISKPEVIPDVNILDLSVYMPQ